MLPAHLGSPGEESIGIRPVEGRLHTRYPAELVRAIAELVDAGPGDVIAVAVVAAESSVARESGSLRIVPLGSEADGWSDLTERELVVAALAGQALTNIQIAHRLFISPHTVGYHLRQIYRKLGIDSRVHLARIVEERRAWARTT